MGRLHATLAFSITRLAICIRQLGGHSGRGRIVFSINCAAALAFQSQSNFSDPESRIMKTGEGYQQCYNGQLAVDDEFQVGTPAPGLVLGRLLGDDTHARALGNPVPAPVGDIRTMRANRRGAVAPMRGILACRPTSRKAILAILRVAL